MTTTTATLAEFLLARVSEDEAMWTLAVEAKAAWVVGSGVPAVPPVEFGKRMLAECESKRRIVEAAAKVASVECWEYTDAPELADLVLEALAAPYADHPEFREEWGS